MTRHLFPQNEGTVDRAIRLVGGAGLLSLAFLGPETPWGLIGLIPIATALIGSCPVYTVFGASTCSVTPK